MCQDWLDWLVLPQACFIPAIHDASLGRTHGQGLCETIPKNSGSALKLLCDARPRQASQASAPFSAGVMSSMGGISDSGRARSG